MIDVNKIWGLAGDVAPITQSTWAVGEDYILKRACASDLNNNLLFLQILASGEIPVAQPIAGRSGDLIVNYGGDSYLLTKRLKGTHITDIYQEDYKTIACETGRIVARLHRAFRMCEKSIPVNKSLFMDELDGWIHDELQGAQWKRISEPEFESSVSQLRTCYEQLPKQLIHRDLHYGNMLFDNMVFTGYIDFDLSKNDARVFDLCYFLLGLLIDHNNETDLPVWFEIIRCFIRGYEELEPLEAVEKEVMPAFMECIELLFAAYFQRQGLVEPEQGAVAMYRSIQKHRSAILESIL